MLFSCVLSIAFWLCDGLLIVELRHLRHLRRGFLYLFIFFSPLDTKVVPQVPQCRNLITYTSCITQMIVNAVKQPDSISITWHIGTFGGSF